MIGRRAAPGSADDAPAARARARLLASGEGSDRRIHHRAAEIEAAEVIAQTCSLVAARVAGNAGAATRGPQLLELVLREVADGEPLAFSALTRERRELTGQQLDQRGLPAPFGPSSPIRAPGRNVASCPSARRDRDTPTTSSSVSNGSGARRRGKLEIERRVDVRSCDALHAVECLQAALRLARLRRLGAEALDEALQMGDLALLLVEHRLLDGELGRAPRLERRIVAGIEREPLRMEVGNVRNARIEEVRSWKRGSACRDSSRASARATPRRRGRGGWWARRAAGDPSDS